MESERRTLTLTDEEKQFAFQSTGEPVPDVYVYCKPCYRLLQQPLSGAELLKGTLLESLRESGVPNAEEVANEYFKLLLSKASKATHN